MLSILKLIPRPESISTKENDMHDGGAHAGAISVTNKVVSAGVAATGIGWLTSEVVIGAVGLTAAIIFGCIGVYYRRKDDQRKELADKREADYFEWQKKATLNKLKKEK